MLPLLCVFVLLVILLVSLDVSWLSLNIIVMALFGFIILFSSLRLYFCTSVLLSTLLQ